jgi:GT2 family glycosyltransferase
VIVVNYNVEHFLDQCLDSVKRASKSCSIETLIVDNSSVDGSLKMLATKYPEYTVIANQDNVGFSKANNQAIKIAKGEYILLLNPDTVVAEDTFSKVIEFMDSHPDAGGLGVHMVDGKGRFLPESKRGLPTPSVAFYKIFGLSKLFPKSKRFGQYHLGHLPDNETNEVDILSGAFMLMRKSALDKVGLLDEDYFMYGEDIDLSYRIQKGGYKNYYFADTSIIHYKGESTKKSSVNYVLIFYKAMVIFAKKHFSGKNARLFSSLINFAIYLRAFFALFSRIIRRIFLPAVDFLYIVIGLYGLTNYWRMSSIDFPTELIKYSIPIYSLAWIITAFINGAYDFPIKLTKYFKSVLFATIIILVAYAILPKDYQFSRLFIFVGAGWALLYFLMSRLFLHFSIGGKFRLFTKRMRGFSVLADQAEFQRISNLLSQIQGNPGGVERLSIKDEQPTKDCEVIFSSKDLSYSDIISCMIRWSDHQQDFKIAPANSTLLIGSNSIDTAGDLYILNLNALHSVENRRKKRLFDICLSTLMLLALPVTLFMYSNKKRLIRNCAQVFVGKRSFIGYSDTEMKTDVRLPKTKEGILSPADVLDASSESIREKLNLLYARDYSMRKDLSIFIKLSRNLDS